LKKESGCFLTDNEVRKCSENSIGIALPISARTIPKSNNWYARTKKKKAKNWNIQSL
tara:strand:+ start:547 stop:717 length:171 start_codon:yes stop_codon:yes gene_type:complete